MFSIRSTLLADFKEPEGEEDDEDADENLNEDEAFLSIRNNPAVDWDIVWQKPLFLYMQKFDAEFNEAQIVVPEAPKSDTGWTNKNKNALKAIREIFTEVNDSEDQKESWKTNKLKLFKTLRRGGGEQAPNSLRQYANDIKEYFDYFTEEKNEQVFWQSLKDLQEKHKNRTEKNTKTDLLNILENLRDQTSVKKVWLFFYNTVLEIEKQECLIQVDDFETRKERFVKEEMKAHREEKFPEDVKEYFNFEDVRKTDLEKNQNRENPKQEQANKQKVISLLKKQRKERKKAIRQARKEEKGSKYVRDKMKQFRESEKLSAEEKAYLEFEDKRDEKDEEIYARKNPTEEKWKNGVENARKNAEKKKKKDAVAGYLNNLFKVDGKTIKIIINQQNELNENDLPYAHKEIISLFERQQRTVKYAAEREFNNDFRNYTGKDAFKKKVYYMIAAKYQKIYGINEVDLLGDSDSFLLEDK